MLTRDGYRRYYDDFYATTDFRHYSERVDDALLAAVFDRAHVRAGARVLDLGCGTGVQLARMRARGMRAVGIDLSLVAVQRASGTSAAGAVAQADALALPFADGALDAVVAIGCSLMNADDDGLVDRLFEESLRVVRPGGCVVATTCSDFSGGEKGGWRQRTRRALQERLERLPGRARSLHYGLPGLARFHRALPLHPLVDALVRLPLPLARTAVFFAWK